MPLRYTDLDTRISEYRDFIIRRQFPTLSELFIICVAVIIFAVGLSLSLNDQLLIVAILLIAGGGICLYVLRQVSHSRDILCATEVQNAFLSSALGIDCLFYFIARADGTIVHFNRAFRDFCPKAPQDGLNVRSWAESQGLSSEPVATIEQAMAKRASGRITMQTRHKSGTQASTLTIEPIPRPAAFFLLRCRARG